MINKVVNDLLIQGLEELYSRSKISNDVLTDATAYIGTLSTQFFMDIDYTDFNQEDSTGCIFDDVSKQVTWDTGTAELLTNSITINPATLKGIKAKALDQNITYQISYNGTTYYNINDYNIAEDIEVPFYLKIIFTQTNTITGLVLNYEL